MSNEQELRAEEMQALFKPIPVWKWVLLHLCPAYIAGYDTEGDIACVCIAKVLFKQIYIVRTDWFHIPTGRLLKTCKLTRRN